MSGFGLTRNVGESLCAEAIRNLFGFVAGMRKAMREESFLFTK